MIPPEKMTESELKIEIKTLELLADAGQLTYESAERLYFLKKCLRRIISVKNGQRLER